MALKQLILLICNIASSFIAVTPAQKHIGELSEHPSHQIVSAWSGDKQKSKLSQNPLSRYPPQYTDPFAPFAPAVADIIIAQGTPIDPKQQISSIGVDLLDMSLFEEAAESCSFEATLAFFHLESRIPILELPSYSLFPPSVANVLVAHATPIDSEEQYPAIIGLAPLPVPISKFLEPELSESLSSSTPLFPSLIVAALKPLIILAPPASDFLVAQGTPLNPEEQYPTIIGLGTFPIPAEKFLKPDPHENLSSSTPLFPALIVGALKPLIAFAPPASDFLIAQGTPLNPEEQYPSIMGLAEADFTLPVPLAMFLNPEISAVITKSTSFIPGIVIAPLKPITECATPAADLLVAQGTPLDLQEQYPDIMGIDLMDLSVIENASDLNILDTFTAMTGVASIIPSFELFSFAPAIADIMIGQSLPISSIPVNVNVGTDLLNTSFLQRLGAILAPKTPIDAGRPLPIIPAIALSPFAPIAFFGPDIADIMIAQATPGNMQVMTGIDSAGPTLDFLFPQAPIAVARPEPRMQGDSFLKPTLPRATDPLAAQVSVINPKLFGASTIFFSPFLKGFPTSIASIVESFFPAIKSFHPLKLAASLPPIRPTPVAAQSSAFVEDTQSDFEDEVIDDEVIVDEDCCFEEEDCCETLVFPQQAVAPVYVCADCIPCDPAPSQNSLLAFFSPITPGYMPEPELEPFPQMVVRERGRYSPFLPKRMEIRHVEGWGQGIGYGTDYTTVALLFAPEYQLGHIMPMLDLRGHRFDNNTYAANVGIGGRFIPCPNSFCELLGFNVFYDFRQGCKGNYNQIGVGLEILGACWDLRANAYAPLGIKTHRTQCVSNFDGGYYAIRRDCEFATYAFNGEFGYTLYDCDPFIVYAAAGPYYLARKCSEHTLGVEARLRPQFRDYLALEFMASYDPYYRGVFQVQIIFSLPLYQLYSQSCKSGPCCITDRQIYQPIMRFEVMPLGRRTCWRSNF